MSCVPKGKVRTHHRHVLQVTWIQSVSGKADVTPAVELAVGTFHFAACLNSCQLTVGFASRVVSHGCLPILHLRCGFVVCACVLQVCSNAACHVKLPSLCQRKTATLGFGSTQSSFFSGILCTLYSPADKQRVCNCIHMFGPANAFAVKKSGASASDILVCGGATCMCCTPPCH